MRLAPNSIDLLYRLGEAYASAGRSQDAIDTWQRAAQIADSMGAADEAQELRNLIEEQHSKVKVH